MLLFHLIKESFLYAINSLVVNKLRTFLSLLGITIGIFSIISVFTVINSLETGIKTSIGTLGDDVIYVQKWPWEFGRGYPWWKYFKRPLPSIKESKEIRRRSKLAKANCFMIFSFKQIQYQDNSIDNVQIKAAEHEFNEIKDFELKYGRYFTEYESKTGKNKIILGSEIAENLFENQNPVNKKVKIGGKKLEVVGVFEKEGQDMFGIGNDDKVLIPINYMKTIVNIKSKHVNPMIMVEPKKNISAIELKEELRGIMRNIRRQKPGEDDNFALNQASLISQGFEQIFLIVDIAGIIIGGFAILVGGFGIANIMFVSVKEQTKLIGIQKALGAKRFFILLQFLFEAIILSLMGGLIGLAFVWLGTKIFGAISSMSFSLSIGNVITGVLLSVIIGIIAGIIPANMASKLNPVDAISKNS